jgi:hypothetical protein
MQGKFKRINTKALNRSKAIIILEHEQNYAITSSHRNVLHLTIHLLVGCNFLNSNYLDHNAQSFRYDYLTRVWGCIQLKRGAATIYITNQLPN